MNNNTWYTLRVVGGAGRGQKLGVPTLNFETPEKFDSPFGVFAGYVKLGPKKYKAAIAWGPRPVFFEAQPVLEAHLIGWDGKQNVELASLALKKFLRPIKAFQNVKALVEQIKQDIDQTKTCLKPKRNLVAK